MPDFKLPQYLAADVRRKILEENQTLIYAAFHEALESVRGRVAEAYQKYGIGGKTPSKVAISAYGRQEKLEKDIVGIINGLRKGTEKDINSAVTDMFRETYHSNQFLFSEGTNRGFRFGEINQKKIAKFLEDNTVNKIKWEDRLKENIYEANFRVKSEVLKGFAQNLPYEKMAERLSNGMGIGAYKAYRIMRTEGHRSQELAHTYTRSQVQEQLRGEEQLIKIWDAIFDNATRDTHGYLDGQRRENDKPFEISGMKAQAPGLFGVAKMDINCRCTARTMIKNAKFKFQQPNTTYREWADKNKKKTIMPKKNI